MPGGIEHDQYPVGLGLVVGLACTERLGAVDDRRELLPTLLHLAHRRQAVDADVQVHAHLLLAGHGRPDGGREGFFSLELELLFARGRLHQGPSAGIRFRAIDHAPSQQRRVELGELPSIAAPDDRAAQACANFVHSGGRYIPPPAGSVTMTVVEIRPARVEEAPDIAAVWLRSRAASAPDIPPPAHTDEEVRAWFTTIVLPTREVWVADIEGTVVAVLVLHDDWIDQLYVDPSHTGQGVGTDLVSVAKRRRPQGLQLWTFQANHRARRFYERHGFVPVETTEGDNEEGAPDVRYEWRPAHGFSVVDPPTGQV